MANKHPIHKFEVTSYTYGIRPITALELKSILEKHMEPGILKPDGAGNMVFVPKSFSTEFCAGMLASSQFKDQLPRLNRLLLFPLPIRIGDELIFPKEGYDSRFGTYLVPDAPKIRPMKIETAREWVKWSNMGFCYTSEQSRTHAIARQLTPFGRGILGWTERVPLWFYCANRPRAGKDYLHGVTSIIYTGSASQDNPIGKDAEETAKRITAAGLAGRWFMYFANCQVPLHDQYLIKTLTDEEIRTRRLGSNDATADLIIPNEMEFGLSANVGLTYREDLEPRMRKIELAFYEEDENSRTFKHPYLHREMKEHRADLLSAYAAIYQHWAEQGFPKGKTPFTTYPKWAEVIGGVMAANGYGDPCLPWKGEFEDAGGDRRTGAMAALYLVCHKKFGEEWTTKKQIQALIIKEAEDNEALEWFGSLEDSEDAKKNLTRLGMALSTFKNRELNRIKMLVNDSVKRTQDRKLRFVPVGSEGAKTTATPPPYSTCLSSATDDEINKKIEIVDISSKKNLSRSSAKLVAEGGRWRPAKGLDFLALDLETYADVVVSGGKKPKIRLSGGAFRPWTGEIRLLTLTDVDGNLQQYDLKATPVLPPEIHGAIGRSPLIIHNAAFDLLFLAVKLGIRPTRVFCTLTASRLLSGSRIVKHDLAAVLERYIGVTLTKEYGASDWGTMLLSPEQLEYAADDVRYLHPLQEKFEAELHKAGLWKVFQMEMDLLPIVVEMELHGFAVDAGKLKEFYDRLRKEASDDAEALRAGLNSPKLNVDSPPQLAEAFTAIGVDLEATNKGVLATIEHPLAKLVLEYRRKDNLAGKAEGLLKHVRPDGRIHARFNPLGTETGRFTSSKPNIQQVPRESGIRECFVASAPDRKLIIADFGQVELRRGAALSQDATMIQAFKDGKDIHRETGGEVLHKAPAEIKGRDRTLAKAVNFGLIYGQGPEGFQRYAKVVYGLDITLEEATEMRTLFFKKYKGLARWHRDAWRKAEAGFDEAHTVMGRRLLARKDDDWARFNLWTNFLDQGDCAEYQKMSMINVARVVPSDVHLVACVHDESIYDVPADRAEELCSTIRLVMIDTWYQLFGNDVPIEIGAKVCDNWAEKG